MEWIGNGLIVVGLTFLILVAVNLIGDLIHRAWRKWFGNP